MVVRDAMYALEKICERYVYPGRVRHPCKAQGGGKN
jgi:hypothetical protein